ncbi:hypothetical protein [Baaleninema simplex]
MSVPEELYEWIARRAELENRSVANFCLTLIEQRRKEIEEGEAKET